MLGGSHGINAMIYLRGNRRDYDNWKNAGNPNWGYDDVLKHFKKSERNADTDFVKHQNGKYHSEAGPLPIGKYRSENDYNLIEDSFVQAGAEAGYDYVNNFNTETNLGYGRVQGTISEGRRQTTAKAFLVPAKNRTNLHIIKHAHATKIELDDANEKVTGVQFLYKGQHKLSVKVRKEVVVSAGALSTPQLLQLSGIGPEKFLKPLGIPVRKNLAVGKNLQDHLIVPMFFSFQRSRAKYLEKDNDVQYILDLHLKNSGLLTTLGITDLVSFINTVNGTGYPDIELHHFAYKKESGGLRIYLEAVGYGTEIQNTLYEANKDAEIAMVYVVLLNPKSVGAIKLKSTDPIEKPSIFPNYLDEDDDWKTTLAGVKYQYNQVNSKAFRENDGTFVRLPLKECEQFKIPSDEYFMCYIDQMTTTVYHPVGTAKMGPSSDKMAVVDSRLKVHGIPNLRVIDASIMPTIVSANTNAPTIMIAEKGSDMIKEDWNNARDEF